jgi:hypothetical protein
LFGGELHAVPEETTLLEFFFTRKEAPMFSGLLSLFQDRHAMGRFCITASLLLVISACWGDWGPPENLGPGVNIYTYNFAPSVSVSGDTLYFTRTVGSWDYEIYMSVFRNGVWDSAVSVSDSINTAATAAACPFISYDGSKLYYSMFPPQNPNVQHLYYSEKRNDVWQGPIRFEAPFNYDSCSVVWPSFTHDMGRLYFYTYNRPGGRGKGDLWYSDYDTLTRTWGTPVNLGDSINTAEWDCCPTLSWDDQTLYYSSDTLPYQNSKICRAQMVNGVWQKGVMLPESPNYPYSMTDNPCLSADGQSLFFMAARLPFPQYGLTDIYVSRWEEGVEEEKVKVPNKSFEFHLIAVPNPFTSFTTLPGRSSERFALYDVSGRKVGVYKGDRIGWGVSSGVYFLRAEKGDRRPVRVVRVR